MPHYSPHAPPFTTAEGAAGELPAIRHLRAGKQNAPLFTTTEGARESFPPSAASGEENEAHRRTEKRPSGQI